MENIELLMNYIFGAGGLSVALAGIMKSIKSKWKPSNKTLYWIPASIIALLASLGLFWFIEIWNFWAYLVTSGLLALAQFAEENEAFKKIFSTIKPYALIIFKRLFDKK